MPIKPAAPAITQPETSTFPPQDWAILARHWYPVARCIDIADQPVQVQLLDVKLVAYRTSAGLSVALDRCPHRGVPLSKGCVKNDHLVCAYHGLTFNGEGSCTRIPAHPSLVPSERFRLRSLPAVERYGLLWTCLTPEPQSDAAIPPMPTWSADEHQQVLPPYVDIQGSAGRQVEGFVDVAHFAFVHHEAFADPDNPVVPTYETTLTDTGIRSDYVSTVSNFPKGMQHLAPEGFQWRRVYEIYPPFTARLTVHFPNDGLLNILNAASPMTATSTRLFVPITRNFDTTGPVEDVYAFNAQVFAEDQDIVESQWPQDLPLDPQAEAHFAADRSSVAYRRRLKEMGLSFKRAVPA
ncbi:aromatic ring-hydroxylating oxygenase subunit alpha [Paracidovorax cattleyae]|uniref:aromatic ring-hydroxylating oxygenase subunit alpha n=1 Tax=Paracidovorax cattleyae TaxID=80868 RepID=UPI0018AFE887|nr:aromatic ring-hydroxylating dioxygenase subunit alpha [Paracidovorax cattleyae]MBF9263333.1 aromatic ring-hydroxylating dioxygenase subunit alpha [Paracidovorax cattleyae]